RAQQPVSRCWGPPLNAPEGALPAYARDKSFVIQHKRKESESAMSRDDVLVTAQWAEDNLNTAGVVFAEVDEDTTAYEGGHIPGAVKIDWRTELQDPVRRDFVDRAGFEKLLSAKGISNDDLVILYGGKDRKSTRLNSSHVSISY